MTDKWWSQVGSRGILQVHLVLLQEKNIPSFNRIPTKSKSSETQDNFKSGLFLFEYS